MSELPTAFHIVDQYLDAHGAGCDNTPIRRVTELIFGKVLDFDSAMKIKGPIICSATTLEGPQRTMNRWIPRLEALAEFEYPLLGLTRAHTPMLPGQMWAEMPRCFDVVFAYNPPACPYPAERWYCPWPIQNGIEKRRPLRAYAEREHDVCYIGKPASQKQMGLIAELLSKHPLTSIIVIGHPTCPPEGMKLYKAMRLYDIPYYNNLPRTAISAILNDARFLAYPTHNGMYPCATLEQTALEAIYCGCAPILNRAWCTDRYRGYPAQVDSEEDCWDLELTERLYHQCIEFMADPAVDALRYNCRTLAEIRADLASRKYAIDPERPRRCKELVEYIQAGLHRRGRNYRRGPFYAVVEPRTYDYHTTYRLGV